MSVNPKSQVTSSGFTLVELLVVIAIIGTLVALLLPAVQAAREAARRSQCSNNLKQLALATHNHVGAYRQFPQGCRNQTFPFGKPRQGWYPYILPYLEEQNVLTKYDFNLNKQANGTYSADVNYGTANSATATSPTNALVTTMLCPSDIGITNAQFTWGYFSFGNYPAVFGGLTLGGADPLTILPTQRAAFGVNFGATFADFRDGTSKTMIYAEYLRSTGETNSSGQVADQRGMLWQSDEPGGGSVFTALSPNSSTKDIFYPSWWCIDRSERNLPCTIGNSTGTDHTAGARSLHPGGAIVAMGDGSVQFVDDSIALSIWQAMATIAGGEVVEIP